MAAALMDAPGIAGLSNTQHDMIDDAQSEDFEYDDGAPEVIPRSQHDEAEDEAAPFSLAAEEAAQWSDETSMNITFISFAQNRCFSISMQGKAAKYEIVVEDGII